MSHNHYVTPRTGEVRLLDELPASFDDVREEFAARGQERWVAGEVPAYPRAVFDLQIGPCLAFPLAKTDFAECRRLAKRRVEGFSGLNAPGEVAGPNPGWFETPVDVFGYARGLLPPAGIQRLIAGALDALLDVPVGFTVPDEYYSADRVPP